jgi:hypothetical protein
VTTLDTNATIRNMLAFWLSNKLRVKTQAEKAASRTARTSTRFQAIVKFVLHIAGFACLTNAAFLWSSVAGWASAGLSLFVVSWLLNSSHRPNSTEQRR